MALARFIEKVVAHVRQAPVDLASLPPEAIPGSIFSGAAGVAFFLHEAARIRREPELLERAHRWYAAGRAWAGHATVGAWRGIARGFLIGETGLSYVDGLLGARSGDSARVRKAVGRIEQASETLDDIAESFRPTEILGGAAGIACATCDLEARLPRGPDYDASRNVLYRVRDRAAGSLLAAYATSINSQSDDLVGFAHGVAGELWALLGIVGANHNLVRSRLSELAELREIDKEGFIYWLPLRRPQWEPFMLGTWCNGMAGHTMLWCEAARQTRSAAWREIARLAAESTNILVTSNPSLCCGLAGQSVALQRYADLSGDERFTRRAYDRLKRAAEIVSAADRSFFGLWHGSLGIALVAMSRLYGDSTFPCLEKPLRMSL